MTNELLSLLGKAQQKHFGGGWPADAEFTLWHLAALRQTDLMRRIYAAAQEERCWWVWSDTDNTMRHVSLADWLDMVDRREWRRVA